MPDRRPEAQELRRSSRDRGDLRTALERWLAGRLPEGARPGIADLEATSATGMSSDTILFDASWIERRDAPRRTERLVARIAPDPRDAPVFPSYDLGRQFDTIRLVAERTDVPVPGVWWYESDPAHVGAPFFVMSRVDGRVPPDLLPYTFGDNWLYDAAPDDQRALQDATVGILAALHGIDGAPDVFPFLHHAGAGDTPLRRHVAHTRAWYDFAAADGTPSALVERGFAWLEDHWPAEEGPTVLSWGDARIGNVLYAGFEPAAVLDWEMCGLGPRELDIGWLIYAHQAFESLAHGFDLGGMPAFLRRDDVAGTYEALTGHTPMHLDWYITYAAVQWGIVFLRTGRRQVHFGEQAMPDDVDEFIHTRVALAQMIGGGVGS